jgi:predicted dehydrogenase
MVWDLAIVGCGYWGKNIVRVFSELRNENIFLGDIILFDVNQDRAKELSKLYKFKLAQSFEEILINKKISSVLIITPSSTHYSLSKKALEAGKNVFVEKPFTLDSNNAKELIKLAKEMDLTLMVGMIFRFHQGLLELKKRLDLGEFGKILFMYGTKFGYSVPNEDAGVIFTLAINDFDIYCFLTGTEYPETISANRGSFLREDLEEITSICLTYPENIHGYFIESWLVPVFDRHRMMYLVGTNKTAVIDYLKPNEIDIYDAKIKKEILDDRMLFKMEKNPMQKVILNFKEPLKEEMKHFITCVTNKERSFSDGTIGYRAVKMCELALKSAKLGKKIIVKDEIE